MIEYLPAGPAGSGTRSHLNLASFRFDAREIWVIVIADSPLKKSFFSPGPGKALSVKMPLCRNVIASTIGCWLNPQVLPSSLHAWAFQPPQTVARFSHVLYSKSRTTMPALPLAATALFASTTFSQVHSFAAIISAGDFWPASFSRSVLT